MATQDRFHTPPAMQDGCHPVGSKSPPVLRRPWRRQIDGDLFISGQGYPPVGRSFYNSSKMEKIVYFVADLVSLASLRDRISKSFPLSSVFDEYDRRTDSSDVTAGDVGNYFALATVFPSRKMLKNGVRLSSNLSSTMGYPSLGRIIFVHSVQSQFLTHHVNGSDKTHTPLVSRPLLHNYEELHLRLVNLKTSVETNRNMLFTKDFSAGKSHGRFENRTLSSPKTPLHKSKFNSLTSGHFDSPMSEEPVSSVPSRISSSIGSVNFTDLLKDESTKKTLQTCANSWLCTRSLLYGNLVAIPILSELCFFYVTRGYKLPSDGSNQDPVNQRSFDLHPTASDFVDYMHDAYVVSHETKVHLYLPLGSRTESPEKRGLPGLQLEFEDAKASMVSNISKLGGLSKEYAVLTDIIISSSVKATLARYFISSLLLHGPPGTGKTSLARLCAHDAGVRLFPVNGPEIVSQYHGESEQALHEVFESASQAVPAVVFIDELDAIAPSRKDGGEELSQRMVATLLNLMDGVSRNDGVLVIAATNRPDSIEPALRRPGRLDREIEIGVPSPTQRLDILQTLLSAMPNSLSDNQVQQLAMATHGFVGADLAALCNEAALVCLRRYAKLNRYCDSLSGMSISHEGFSEVTVDGSNCSKDITDVLMDTADSSSSQVLHLPVSNENSPSFCMRETTSEVTPHIQTGSSVSSKGISFGEEDVLRLAFEDFEKAKLKVRPSAMREVILEVPKVNWEDVGGQREVKAQLMEAVEWPQKHQDAFKRIGTRPPTGILMFGPPGCSKTLMARAAASEAGLNFLAVKGPELFSKWVGESEKAVRSLFARARANAPSIIFFDEIDGLAVIRGKESDGVSVSDRVMSQLLVELDGLHQRVDVTVIAATNRPDKIDPALLRPGRFDRLLYVGPPNDADREDVFCIHLRKIPCSSDISMKELASLRDGYTGADIALICREAAIAAIEESIDASEVTMQHLKAAIRQVEPSELRSYEELSVKFQRLVRSSARGDALKNNQFSSRSNNKLSIRSWVKSAICSYMASWV
ncbi:calmodulin-interacting protein [Tripterygium wilfordii]|uniref:Calmodulin-interacting protein n=1 Tax=Tripterygium wilfordii TaxID=458696 RepID=A0A7J7DVC5_TRIWF|nr:calmodulin-interacting protein [Tripterygium wilfordii]